MSTNDERGFLFSLVFGRLYGYAPAVFKWTSVDARSVYGSC